MHGLARTLRARFYKDPAGAGPNVPPAVPAGFFAGCLLVPRNPSCDAATGTLHHTDYGHSIKSMWMLYLIGREAGDDEMTSFAKTRAPGLLDRAFLDDSGSWAQTDRSIDPDHYDEPVWWIFAELDQTAATLALADSELARNYLARTYPFWLEKFVDRGSGVHEVWHGLTRTGSEQPIPKAHLWKNGFHSFEHALVALITTAGLLREPVRLHFATSQPERVDAIRPYYFQADRTKVVSREPLAGDLAGLTKLTVEFEGIR